MHDEGFVRIYTNSVKLFIELHNKLNKSLPSLKCLCHIVCDSKCVQHILWLSMFHVLLLHVLLAKKNYIITILCGFHPGFCNDESVECAWKRGKCDG